MTRRCDFDLMTFVNFDREAAATRARAAYHDRKSNREWGVKGTWDRVVDAALDAPTTSEEKTGSELVDGSSLAELRAGVRACEAHAIDRGRHSELELRQAALIGRLEKELAKGWERHDYALAYQGQRMRAEDAERRLASSEREVARLRDIIVPGDAAAYEEGKAERWTDSEIAELAELAAQTFYKMPALSKNLAGISDWKRTVRALAAAMGRYEAPRCSVAGCSDASPLYCEGHAYGHEAAAQHAYETATPKARVSREAIRRVLWDNAEWDEAFEKLISESVCHHNAVMTFLVG